MVMLGQTTVRSTNCGCSAAEVTAMGTNALVFPHIQTVPGAAGACLLLDFPCLDSSQGPPPLLKHSFFLRLALVGGMFPY